MTASTGTVPTWARRPTGVGIIGLGTFGRFCLDAYMRLPEVQAVGFADPAPAALTAGSRLVPFAHAYGDTALLLERPVVHAVHICAPPDQHLPLVLAALAAGKRVICEKPLGLSLLDFDTAQAAAVRHSVVLSISLVLRHDLLHRAVEALLQNGVLGRPYRLSVDNYADEAISRGPDHWLWHPARSGDLALAADVHWFDVVCRLLVSARWASPLPGQPRSRRWPLHKPQPHASGSGSARSNLRRRRPSAARVWAARLVHGYSVWKESHDRCTAATICHGATRRHHDAGSRRPP